MDFSASRSDLESFCSGSSLAVSRDSMSGMLNFALPKCQAGGRLAPNAPAVVDCTGGCDPPGADPETAVQAAQAADAAGRGPRDPRLPPEEQAPRPPAQHRPTRARAPREADGPGRLRVRQPVVVGVRD